jgi:hypothetical protein
MKRILILAMALLLLVLDSPPVFAQGAGIEWEILNQEANELYREGNYGDAITMALLKACIGFSEKRYSPQSEDRICWLCY